jgi:nucleotide-binding universal stress UspA family protein
VRVLFAIDGSASALVAGLLLTRLPLEADSEIAVVTVVEGEDQSDSVLAAARMALAGSRAQVAVDVRHGHPAEAILQAAEEQPPDLIALGARGVNPVARFFLGSVAERVAQYAPCPVLVARPVEGELKRVILGIDESPGAACAADWLKRAPLPPGCEVYAVTSLPFYRADTTAAAQIPGLVADVHAAQRREKAAAETLLEEVATAFREAGKQAVPEFRQQHPAAGLIEAAEAHQAGLIVVGRRGLSRIERFTMGSVSTQVLRHAACSVLIVPDNPTKQKPREMG